VPTEVNLIPQALARLGTALYELNNEVYARTGGYPHIVFTAGPDRLVAPGFVDQVALHRFVDNYIEAYKLSEIAEKASLLFAAERLLVVTAHLNIRFREILEGK
jgi:hypothetical protein